MSAAAVLLQGGKWRTMTNSNLVRPEEDATPAELQMFSQLVEIVAKRTGMSVTERRGLFNNTFIKADRALELGLIDEIR